MALHIDTERLILRNAKPEDAAILYQDRESEFVQRYNAMKSITPGEMAELVLKDSQGDNAAYIELKENRRVIGAIWLEEDSLRHKANAICTSCWLGEEYSGMGYMTEAYKALIDYLFDQQRADVIVARVFSDNLASRRMMEKVGFVQEGVLRHAVMGYRGKIFDDVLYSILRSEWGR